MRDPAADSGLWPKESPLAMLSVYIYALSMSIHTHRCTREIRACNKTICINGRLKTNITEKEVKPPRAQEECSNGCKKERTECAPTMDTT